MPVLARALSFIAGLCMMGGLFWLVYSSDLFRINEIHVSSMEEHSSQTFESIAPALSILVEKWRGRRLWFTQLDELKQEVARDPRVSEVVLERSWLGWLNVKVKAHKPRLIIPRAKAQWSAIARDGTLLPPGRRVFDLPVLRGVNFLKNQDLRERAVELIEALPAPEDFSGAQISEVEFNSTEGFYVWLSESPTMIKLGHKNFEVRLQRVGRVLSYLKKERLEGRVIDTRFTKKVVVRPRNAP